MIRRAVSVVRLAGLSALLLGLAAIPSGAGAVDPSADLSLVVADAPDPVFAGEAITYTLSIENLGPNSASEVTVVDTLAAGVRFVSASPGCEHEAGVVTCDLGTVASADSPEVEIVVLTEHGGLPVNEAIVESSTDDPALTNNQRETTTTVVPSADVSIGLKDSSDPVLVGDRFTYVLRVANDGPDPAQKVTAEGALALGTSLVSAPAGCQEGGGVVSCELGTIAAAASSSIEITVRADLPGSARAEASAESSTHDADPSDNTAAETTTIESLGLTPTPPRRARCRGIVATIIGSRGPDRLKGTKRRDVIVGLGGGDRLFGRGGNDLICGGSGSDRLFGGPGRDRLIGGPGKDVVRQ